jgi:hypothetical protein
MIYQELDDAYFVDVSRTKDKVSKLLEIYHSDWS